MNFSWVKTFHARTQIWQNGVQCLGLIRPMAYHCSPKTSLGIKIQPMTPKSKICLGYFVRPRHNWHHVVMVLSLSFVYFSLSTSMFYKRAAQRIELFWKNVSPDNKENKVVSCYLVILLSCYLVILISCYLLTIRRIRWGEHLFYLSWVFFF